MSSSRKRKRITMKLKTPNPLFIKWMTEYRDRAKEEGSKMQFVFNNALESLKKYPLPLENGRDCKILKGFGDKLCKMLDNKLNEHRKKQNGDHLSDTIIGPVHINKESDEINKSDNMPPKCSDLVRKISDDVQPLTRQTKGKKTIQAHTSSSSAVSSQEDNIVLPPDTYDIILYVDTCETAGGSTEIHDDPILSKLRLLSVNCEVKSLKVGDYVWICRDRTTKREFVLPYIIERKRMDDFAQSIKDGRYHEQKFRLKRSGIQNITYLIEKHDNKYVGLPLTTLYQAATNTAIQDGFSVQFTENYKHTAKYLADFSLSLIKMFKAKTCVSCLKENLPELNFEDDLISVMNFEEFNKSSLKNKALKVSDLFVKMLIQIKGMSVERALAIVHEYPTPASLQQAYKQQSSGIDGEKLLANIQFGDSKKNIGLTLSKTVYQLFTFKTF